MPKFKGRRCPDYDDPTKIIDENADEYLCEYCGMRGKECDGRGNIFYSHYYYQLRQRKENIDCLVVSWAVSSINIFKGG